MNEPNGIPRIHGWRLAVDRAPQFLSILILFCVPFVTQLRSMNPILIKQVLVGILVPFILAFWLIKTAWGGKGTFVFTPSLLSGSVLLLWCLWTIVRSPYPEAAWNAWWDWYWVPLWFFVLTQTCYELWRAENLLVTLMAASLGTALWGLAQMVGFPPGPWLDIVRLKYSGHAIAGMSDPEHLAGFLHLVWPFALALLLRAKSTFARIYWGGTLVCTLGCLLATKSGTGALGLLIGGGIFAAFTREKWMSANRRLIAYGLTAALIIGAILAAAVSMRFVEESVRGDWKFRRDTWKSGISILEERPITGSGFGTFRAASPSHRSIEMRMLWPGRNEESEHPGNFLVEWAAETGIVGLLLLSVFWGAVLWPWWKLYRARAIPSSLGAAAFAAFSGAAVHGLFNADSALPGTLIPLLFLAALTGPLSQRFLGIPGYPIRVRIVDFGRFRSFLFLPALAAFGFALWSVPEGLNRQWSDIALKSGYTVSGPGHWDDAVSFYERSLRYRPDNLLAHYVLGVVLQERWHEGDLERAVGSLKAVMSVEPDFARVHQYLAKAYELLEQPKQAQSELDRAIQLDPHFVGQTPEFKKARALSGEGHRKEALALLNGLAERLPQCPILWYEIGVIHVLMDEKDAAIEAYRRALEIYPAYVDALNGLGYVAATAGRMDLVLQTVASLKRYYPGQPWVADLERHFGEAVPTPGPGRLP